MQAIIDQINANLAPADLLLVATAVLMRLGKHKPMILTDHQWTNKYKNAAKEAKRLSAMHRKIKSVQAEPPLESPT